jgi:hypothetical protein
MKTNLRVRLLSFLFLTHYGVCFGTIREQLSLLEKLRPEYREIHSLRSVKSWSKKKIKYIKWSLETETGEQSLYQIIIPIKKKNKHFPDFVTQDFIWDRLIDKKIQSQYFGIRLEETFYHSLSTNLTFIENKIYLLKKNQQDYLSPAIVKQSKTVNSLISFR